MISRIFSSKQQRRKEEDREKLSFQLTLKIPNKNSIVKNDKKMATGGKFLGRFSRFYTWCAGLFPGGSR